MVLVCFRVLKSANILQCPKMSSSVLKGDVWRAIFSENESAESTFLFFSSQNVNFSQIWVVKSHKLKPRTTRFGPVRKAQNT